MLRRVEVAVLGPVAVRLDGAEVDLGTPKQRTLVAALALARGRPVSVDSLVGTLWGDEPPPSVTTTLQAYVSGLRRVLEPGRQRRAPARVLVTTAPGYALLVDDLDARRFEEVLAEEHARLAPADVARPDVGLDTETLEKARDRLAAALGWWRGRPYAELADVSAAEAERGRLEELRLLAVEDLAVADLALGRHATVAAELETLTAEHPLRERLWGLRAVSLARSSRQADALDVLRQVREVLDEELGLEPSEELRQLQTAILRQDAALAWVPPRRTAVRGPATDRPAAPGPASAAPVDAGGSTRPPVPVAPWPMVGRDEELAALTDALAVAESGTATYAVLTGEPGIGKSRLAAELAATARARGVRVVVGRCSQDGGAPPLWPWATVVEAVGGRLPTGSGGQETDPDSQFRSWEELTRTVREAARSQPLVVLLDDLHWADPATLRVLRLLVETADTERLLVIATWRSHPEPTGPLADAAESLARRHARRLQLTGLHTSEVAGLFSAVATAPPSPEQAGDLRARTDGNPFFVVEFARLAEQRGDLSALLAEDHPPTAVTEVLARRVERLPATTVTALRAAAVLGRQFDLDTLAAATGIDSDQLLDTVEPAQAAGLVREAGVDRFLFAHALVRDTLYNALTPSRRGRLHVRVAGILAGRPGRETEVARHWLQGGPAYAGQAWRSAVTAAGVARRLHAHEEAAELLRLALGSMPTDPEAGPADRYDVLLQLVDAYRWTGMWPELVVAVEEAVAVAEGIGDPTRVAQAAIATSQGALWQSAPHGETNGRVVAALRRSLNRLPAGDSPLRCRVLASLGHELYYGSSVAERERLAEESLAMARRLDDDRLRHDVCQIGFRTLWRPATAPQRLELADEACRLARRVADEKATAIATVLRAVVLGELGRPAEMWEAVREARADAERLRLPYGMIVLDSLALPWLAMAGELEECARLIGVLTALDAQISLRATADALAGAIVAAALWSGRAAEIGPVMLSLGDGPLPVQASTVSFLWRGGQEDQARDYFAAHPPRLGNDDWFSMLNWCCAAEISLYLRRPELAGRAYALLAPFAGMSCSAGSGNAMGPVDGFLAMAAAAVGDTDLAARHASAAEQLMETWRIPLAAAWFRDQRARYHF